MSPSLLCSDGDAPRERRQSTIDCKLLESEKESKKYVIIDIMIILFNVRLYEEKILSPVCKLCEGQRRIKKVLSNK